jgi:hypothetical protein
VDVQCIFQVEPEYPLKSKTKRMPRVVRAKHPPFAPGETHNPACKCTPHLTGAESTVHSFEYVKNRQFSRQTIKLEFLEGDVSLPWLLQNIAPALHPSLFTPARATLNLATAQTTPPWLLHLPYTPPSSLLRAPTFVRLLKPLHAFALLFVSSSIPTKRYGTTPTTTPPRPLRAITTAK